MKFLRNLLATLVGLFLFTIFGFFLLIGFVAAIGDAALIGAAWWAANSDITILPGGDTAPAPEEAGEQAAKRSMGSDSIDLKTKTALGPLLFRSA